MTCFVISFDIQTSSNLVETPNPYFIMTSSAANVTTIMTQMTTLRVMRMIGYIWRSICLIVHYVVCYLDLLWFYTQFDRHWKFLPNYEQITFYRERKCIIYPIEKIVGKSYNSSIFCVKLEQS